jgi:formate-dependent nitrite reductase membrane component NrfD
VGRLARVGAMLLDRLNLLHWEALVYLEMFVAGLAAGAYMVAALLDLAGRGRSPLARTAHLLAFPLVVIAALLLTLDLERRERFWHMVIQSETFLPMFKPWSPISLGSGLLFLFGGLTFVSFVDTLVDAGRPWVDGRRAGRALHGSILGRLWSVLGLLLAFGIAAYSGVLLSATNFPGWGDSVLIGPVYVATAIITGAAALVLIQALRGRIDPDVVALYRTNAWLIGWWLVVVVMFLATLGEGLRFILAGPAAVAMIAAVVLGGLAPLALRFAGPRATAVMPLSALLVLVGGVLVRYAIVMGPQIAR